MVTVGVTGHRILAEIEKLEAGIDQALSEIERVFGGPLVIVSALAEGADRLVAEAVLKRPGARLHAVLPMPRDQYERDFEVQASKMAFRQLLGRAAQVEEVKARPIQKTSLLTPIRKLLGQAQPAAPEDEKREREDSYLAGGQYLVDHCDVLIAVWDGEVAQGRGGTGAIVNQARNYGMPLAWVHAGNRKAGTMEPTSLGAEQGMVTFERFVPRHRHFDTDDTEADLSWWALLRPELELVAQKVHPVYRAADDAALVHQWWHRRIMYVAAIFGMCAVLLAVLQLSGLLPGAPLASVEVGAAVMAAISVVLGGWAARHPAWLLERHRAERCRMLKFTFLADAALWSGDASLVEQAQARLDEAVAEIQALTPAGVEHWLEEDMIPEPPLDLDRGQLVDARIEKVIDYYEAKRVGYQRRYFRRRAGQNTLRDRLTRPILAWLFFGSVIAAGGHFVYDLAVRGDGHEGSVISVVLIVLAAALPVVAGTVREIRGAHEFARNRSRFLAKSVALAHLAERIRAEVHAAHAFTGLWGCELILESEHREWLRLMTEADGQP